MAAYKLYKKHWVMPFFVIFRCVRDILRVTVAFDHPVAVMMMIVMIIMIMMIDDSGDGDDGDNNDNDDSDDESLISKHQQ